MDDNASNFDANATEDDGSCLYPVIFTLDTTCSGLDTSKGVFVNGTMNEWCGDCWPMEESGDGVFTTTKDLPLGEVEYKFTIGEEWEALPECGDCVLVFNDGEYINRVTTVVASVNVLDTVAFGTCVACGETPCCTAAADCPASSGNPCEAYTCEEGACVPVPANEGGTCTPAVACKSGLCKAGTCQPTEGVCNDLVGCTEGRCWQVECSGGIENGCEYSENGATRSERTPSTLF